MLTFLKVIELKGLSLVILKFRDQNVSKFQIRTNSNFVKLQELKTYLTLNLLMVELMIVDLLQTRNKS